MGERLDVRPSTPDAVARDLLRLGNRGPPRTTFLREASALLFPCTGARALVAWLEDGTSTFLWRAEHDPSRALDFELLPPREPSRSLMDRAVEAIGMGGSPAPASADGGLYLPALSEIELGPSARLALGTDVGSLLLLPFEIDADNEGVLQLESPERAAFDDVGRLQSTAEVLGVAIAARRVQAARAERVKELACMYGIARTGADATVPLDEMMERIVGLLPPAWQYPEITTARITLGDRTFLSPDFTEGPHRLEADIAAGDRRFGSVEVFYVPERGDFRSEPLLERTPFLPEEQQLIEGVGREVASIVERKRADEERTRLHEQVHQAERLATVGHLAAGLAHELNEPLGNILGFAQLSLKLPDLPQQAAEDLEWIVRSSLYAREVIKKLMLFARRTPGQPSDVDLNEIVRDSLPLLGARSSATDVTVQTRLSPSPLHVRGDRGQLQQVCVNLAVNAVQAMPDGGVLRVSTESAERHVVLEIEDTGSGIAVDIVDEIFEPFFTTKDVGEGTGLGLSVVHGIVTAHGGSIEVDSEPGRGTKMRVLLPSLTPNGESDVTSD